MYAIIGKERKNFILNSLRNPFTIYSKESMLDISKVKELSVRYLLSRNIIESHLRTTKEMFSPLHDLYEMTDRQYVNFKNNTKVSNSVVNFLKPSFDLKVLTYLQVSDLRALEISTFYDSFWELSKFVDLGIVPSYDIRSKKIRIFNMERYEFISHIDYDFKDYLITLDNQKDLFNIEYYEVI